MDERIAMPEKTVAELKEELAIEKQKTHLLDHIIASMPGNVYWTDQNGICLGCNQNLIDIMNFKSKDEIVGHSPYDFMSSELAERTRANDLKIMTSGVEQTFEEKGFDKNGKTAIYLTKKVPLKDITGSVVGLVGVSLDITDRKLMEMALRDAKVKAEVANEAKTDFLDNMRHDFRTPLSNIVGLSTILGNAEKDSEKKQFMNAIQVSGKALLDLMTKILEFNNLETGENPIIYGQFNLEKLVADLIDINKVGIVNKHIQLVLNYDKDIPHQLIGDKERVHRILLNLLSNAVKFTHEGSITISINVVKKQKETVTLKFMVQDTGIGIPQDQFYFVFEKFSRLTHSYDGLYKGEGLGLYIVKHFIEELGGKIELDSIVNQGTTFTCFIPFKLPLTNEGNNLEVADE